MAEEATVDTCLPERPQEPRDSDCCGTGCTPCVFDIYEQELKLWKRECERIRDGVRFDETDQDEFIAEDRYNFFEILSITTETHDSNIYRFKVPNNGLLPLGVGYHLILKGHSSDKPVTRQYTPVLHGKGFFDVVIKLYENGPMSGFIKSWKVGDLAEWRGPFGLFTYKPNEFRHLIMLAAGTGIAPMIPVIRNILENEEDETFATLLYSCKRYNEILYKHQLDEWQQYWNFSCVYVLSKETAKERNDIRYGDQVQYGRINEDMIGELMGDNSDKTFVIICGTRSFDKDMINYAKRCGIRDHNYFKF